MSYLQSLKVLLSVISSKDSLYRLAKKK